MANLFGDDDILTRDDRGASGSGGSDLNKIEGTPGNDNLVGTAVADKIEGAAGNDTIRGRSGNDVLDGQSGNDQSSAGPATMIAKAPLAEIS